MFTGLIESTGTILSVVPSASTTGPTRLTVSAPAFAPKLRLGDSIAVSGVCLTALDLTVTQFTADLAQETVQRTTLARLTPGAVVNLELPTPAGSPLGGHVVQGHVDGIGHLLSVEALDPTNEATTDWRLRLQIPAELTKYVAPQGSITVDGISLTVASIRDDIVAIAIIPHTYVSTAIRSLLPGTEVNLEVDILAKYAERQARATHPESAPTLEKAWTVTEEYLLANGY